MKTVIEMAREATLLDSRDDWGSVPIEYEVAINAFAELIRADERSSWPAEMEAMERQVNILTDALAEARSNT